MYCKHCYRIMEDGTDICPACGRSQAEKVRKQPKKRTWHFYVGIFCAFGAFVMLFENIIGSLVYAVAAFLLLKKAKGIAQSGSFQIASAESLHPPVDIPVKNIEPDQVTSSYDDSSSVPVIKSDECRSALSKPPVDNDAVNAITQRLRKETIREAYGDEAAEFHYPSAQKEQPVSTHTKDSLVPSLKSFTARVTGMEHYLDNIMNLAAENPDYEMSKLEIIDNFMTDKKIYEYNFYASNVKLVPEPENPFDSNAVMVIIDGQHVGYIKAGSCARILKLLREDRIHRVEAEVGGGKYKLVYEDDDDDTYTLERDKTKFFVHLTIYEKVR